MRYPLTRSGTPLVASVTVDQILIDALTPFDLDPHTDTVFHPWELPSGHIPAVFGIGLIVGGSGSGKSTLLREFGAPILPTWQAGKAIASHFTSGQEAAAKLGAVGLNSVPAWRQDYYTLSTGQRFRADLARTLGASGVVDEFTSVIDRAVAKSASRAIRAWADRSGSTGLVLASCHRDVTPWLRPDWIIDTDAGILTVGESEPPVRWYTEHVTGAEVGSLELR